MAFNSYFKDGSEGVKASLELKLHTIGADSVSITSRGLGGHTTITGKMSEPNNEFGEEKNLKLIEAIIRKAAADNSKTIVEPVSIWTQDNLIDYKYVFEFRITSGVTASD